ncbi:MAG: reprolysin-like metallopeptidase, partial [Bacteroidota bacterium]
MIKTIAKIITPFLFILLPFIASSQLSWKSINPVDLPSISAEQVYIKTQNAFLFDLDLVAFRQKIEQGLDRADRFPITIPNEDGQVQTFLIQKDDLLPKGLQEKYSTIRVYKGWKVDDPSTRIRLNYSATSFHAIISNEHTSTYIDPYMLDNQMIYQVYDSKNCTEAAHSTCSLEMAPEHVHLRGHQQKIDRGGTLVYRLAVSASYNYFEFFGNSVENTMAAIVTSINRVNQIYEVDLGMRFQLVENNDTLIVTDPNASTFQTSGFEGDENQRFIDNRIGTSNYDIGHVVGVGFDAYAWLGAACDGFNKARGYTSTPSPRGDPFDIDFLSHELGHQMGANHSFNGTTASCGAARFGFAAFEPGAGSTIMGYAGLCGTDDFQPNSDPYFHGGSVRQVQQYIAEVGGACPTIDSSQNEQPVITFQEDELFIPILTPFELEAQASDPDGDELTYCWEQVDLGGATQLGTYGSGNAPLFRSYPPTTNPKRVFPRKENLLNNRFIDTELLPNQDRTLNFQLTVRDNATEGAVINWGEVGYNVSSAAGPFRVQNIGMLTANTYEIITWEVANTNLPPINTDSVEIWLSVDAGENFDRLLATTENDGSAIVFIPPGVVSNEARLKIKAHENIYFDYTDDGFPVQALDPNESTLEIVAEVDDLIFCSPDTVRIPIFINRSGVQEIFFSGSVEGFTPEFSTFDAELNQLELILLGGETLASGSYKVTFTISSEQAQDSISFPVLVSSEEAQLDLMLLSPGLDSLDIPISPDFSWGENPLASSYTFFLASDPNFDTILFQRPALQDTFFSLPFGLDPTSTYYWQISANNELCGTTSLSAVWAFTTEDVNCRIFGPSDLPINFNALPFIQSRILVEESLIIRDVNILDITGSYTDPSGLNFKIRSPDGPVVDIIDRGRICNEGADFDFSVDDDAPSGFVPCPNDRNFTILPDDPMTVFNDQDAQGTWQLTIFDDGGSGSLTGWKLEICFGGSNVTSVREQPEVDAPNVKVFPNPFEEQFTFILE